VPSVTEDGAPNAGDFWYMGGGNKIGVLFDYEYIQRTDDDGDSFDDITPGSKLVPNISGRTHYRFPSSTPIDASKPWMFVGTSASFPASLGIGSAILYDSSSGTYSTKGTPGDAGYPGGGQGIQSFGYNPDFWCIWGGQALFATMMIAVTADNGNSWETMIGDFAVKAGAATAIRKSLVYQRGFTA